MLALGKNDFPTNLDLLRFLYLCFPSLMNSEIQKDLEQRNYYKNPIAAPRLRRGFLEIQPIAARKLRIPPILSTMSTRRSSAGGLARLCTNSLQFHIHLNYKVRIFFDLLSFFLAHHRQNSWHCFSPDFHSPTIVLDRIVTLSHNYSSGIAGHPRPERSWSIWWLRNGSPPVGTRVVVSIIYGISSFEYFVRSCILPETSKCHFETSTCSYYMRRSRKADSCRLSLTERERYWCQAGKTVR